MKLMPFLEALQQADIESGLEYFSECHFEDVGRSISCQMYFGTKIIKIPEYLKEHEFDSIRIERSMNPDKHISCFKAVLTIPNTTRRNENAISINRS